MNIWLISPYHAGSHRAWAEGYARCSRHTVSLLTMSGSFWKWRMQGGAIELTLQAQRLLEAGPPPDVILATDMLNLPAWLGLMRRSLPASIPVALYMHENQLTYPWRPGEGRDLSFAMINWLSQLVADVVFFNSRYHLDAWFGELPNLLKHFPDYNHLEQIEEVRAQRGAACRRRSACDRQSGGLSSQHRTERRKGTFNRGCRLSHPCSADFVEPTLGVRQTSRPLFRPALSAARRASHFGWPSPGKTSVNPLRNSPKRRTPRRRHCALGVRRVARSLLGAAGRQRPGHQHGGA